jgi:hypothetical protein
VCRLAEGVGRGHTSRLQAGWRAANTERSGRLDDTLSASMYRNIAFMLTNIFLYGTLALLLNIFEYGFAIAGVSMLALAVVNLVAMGSLRSARN